MDKGRPSAELTCFVEGNRRQAISHEYLLGLIRKTAIDPTVPMGSTQWNYSSWKDVTPSQFPLNAERPWTEKAVRNRLSVISVPLATVFPNGQTDNLNVTLAGAR